MALAFISAAPCSRTLGGKRWLGDKPCQGRQPPEAGAAGPPLQGLPPSHTRPPRSTADPRDAASSAIYARIHAAGNIEQFLGICDALSGYANGRPPLWDAQAGFFKDLIIGPDDSWCHIDVYSMVGLIPLFATEVVDRRLLSRAPRFRTRLRMHKGGLFRGHYVCACPEWENERGEHLLSVVDHTMIQPMLSRLMDEGQFLSPFGVRSVSKIHATHRDLGVLPGVGMAIIEYVPGESTSALFGGNSNWRGPIWLPVNYMLIQAIEKFHRFSRRRIHLRRALSR